MASRVPSMRGRDCTSTALPPYEQTSESHSSQPHEPATPAAGIPPTRPITTLQLYHRTQSSAPQLLSSAIRAPNGSENSGLGVRRRALLLFVKGGPADAS
jgi:hypothetical protein